MHTYRLPARQHGAILVVSLLILLVMTVLALTASQSTRLQERMAGNARDVALSFQASEAGLVVAEKRIDADLAPKGSTDLVRCIDPDDCDVVGRDQPSPSYYQQEQKWWDDRSHNLGESLEDVRQQPQYITEERADIPDSLTIGGATRRSGTMYFTNTARAVGATDTAVSILETTYATRY